MAELTQEPISVREQFKTELLALTTVCSPPPLDLSSVNVVTITTGSEIPLLTEHQVDEVLNFFQEKHLLIKSERLVMLRAWFALFVELMDSEPETTLIPQLRKLLRGLRSADECAPPATPEIISGALEVGNDGQNVVVNHPALHTDEKGVGHIVFSARQARNFATLLFKHANEVTR